MFPQLSDLWFPKEPGGIRRGNSCSLEHLVQMLLQAAASPALLHAGPRVTCTAESYRVRAQEGVSLC